MGRYNEEDMTRETYGGPPKGWSARERSSAPSAEPWQKSPQASQQSADAQFQVGRSAPGTRSPQTQPESSPAE